MGRPTELREEIASCSKALRGYLEELESETGVWVPLNPVTHPAGNGQIAVSPFLILLNQRTGTLKAIETPSLPQRSIIPAAGPLKEVPH